MSAIQEEKKTEVVRNISSLDDTKEIRNISGGSLLESQLIVLEEEEQQQNYQEKIRMEIVGKDKLKLDYTETQMNIILSDTERKIMWDEYKHYIDETLFIVLLDTALCR